MYQFMDKKGIIHQEDTAQDRFLRKIYTCFYGRVLLKLLTRPELSRTVGLFLSTRASILLIKPFIKGNRLDMGPYEKRPYRSFNDFFTRVILPTERMIDCDPSHLVSPCDGKLSVYRLDNRATFPVKGRLYTLEEILQNSSLARRYIDGYAMVFRLSVDNYHRYCYPSDGVKSENIRIPGILHTVNPVAVKECFVYHENTREYSLLRTERFGTLIQMEVGAMLVGRITNYHGPKKVTKGSEKGKFEFGGSTIVLFVQKDKAAVRDIFLKNTREDIETEVRMGECIGVTLQK